MKIILEYESDTLLVKKLEESIRTMEKNIIEDKYERDKIVLHISRMKGELIRWLAEVRKKEE